MGMKTKEALGANPLATLTSDSACCTQGRKDPATPASPSLITKLPVTLC